jgi:hypothetical protein
MTDSATPRRSFLARFAASAAVLGAAPTLAAIGCAPSAAPAAPPTSDELDTWFADMKAPNRVLYDCVQAAGGPDGIMFARNFMKFSAEKLGTKDADMNVIVSFRHFATPYGYTDAMWAKYPQFAALLKVEDPTTKKPAARTSRCTMTWRVKSAPTFRHWQRVAFASLFAARRRSSSQSFWPARLVTPSRSRLNSPRI